VLAVIPHPDDELWFAGTLALAARGGAAVSLLCVTRGEAGTDYLAREGGRLKGEALAAWRDGELDASARILGVGEVTRWGLPDGGLEGLEPTDLTDLTDPTDPTEQDDVVARLVALMDGVDRVLTLGRDGIYGHRDHVAVTRWVEAALVRLGSDGRPVPAAFGVVFPPGVFDAQWTSFAKRRPELAVSDWIAKGRGTALGDEAWSVDIGAVENLKRQAIRAHASQLRGPDEAAFFVPGTLPLMLGFERFERLGPGR
jgi:LmbE family N-acetylglucosaminyl deacetylase